MKNIILEKLEELGEDIYYNEYFPNCILVEINDFEGFDDDWNEVNKEFLNPQKIKDFTNFIEKHCLYKEGYYYVTYHFNNFKVEIYYTSCDI